LFHKMLDLFRRGSAPSFFQSPPLPRLAPRVEADYRKNIRRLERFRDAYAGERCFILGNGPSLAHMDLEKLRNEHTFGLNRIYLLSQRTGFSPSFLVAVNTLVLEQFGHEIDSLPMPKFLGHDSLDHVRPDALTFFLRYNPIPGFYHGFQHGLWHGATVTFVAIQIAHFMGFTSVYLIGVDHRFECKGQPHERQTSRQADPNHFDPSYFGPGVDWHLPDLETSETAYHIAKIQFRESRRRIANAGLGGELNIFPRVDFNSLFQK
jgi:hypothetical protein